MDGKSQLRPVHTYMYMNNTVQLVKGGHTHMLLMRWVYISTTCPMEAEAGFSVSMCAEDKT